MAEQTPASADLTAAIAYHQQGDLAAAQSAYERVLNAEPEQPDAWHLLGVLRHQLGDSETAIQWVGKSLALNPRQPRAHNNLGNILAACGRADEALASYAAAIAVQSGYAQAYHNRGNVLAGLERTSEAMASYEQALAHQPDYTAAHQALAPMYEQDNRLEKAGEHYRWLVEHDLASRLDFLRLGGVLRKLNQLDDAREIYRQWLNREPGDALAQHYLAACGDGLRPDRAADEVVRATFDGFAGEFDSCLARLGYRVPTLVAETVGELWNAAGMPAWDVADLGCGTGLCAPPLRPLAGRLVGVDLSAPMLAKARERGLYDELVEEELSAFLRQRPASFDLLVSGDTFVYLGDLVPVFSAAAQALRVGGALAFSVERQVGESSARGFELNRFGRYVHEAAYVHQTLSEASFDLLVSREEVLRLEAGVPVPGLLVAGRKR